MSRLNTILLLSLLSLLFVCGCEVGDDPGGGDEVVPGQAIAGTWFVEDTVDANVPQTQPGGVDKQIEAGAFVGFRITITPSVSEVAYVTQGNISPVIFPPQGTLVVEESDDFAVGAEITRQPDLIPMTVQVFESDSLQIEFAVGGDSSIPANNSREAGISGNYRLMMMRQQTQ